MTNNFIISVKCPLGQPKLHVCQILCQKDSKILTSCLSREL